MNEILCFFNTGFGKYGIACCVAILSPFFFQLGNARWNKAKIGAGSSNDFIKRKTVGTLF